MFLAFKYINISNLDWCVLIKLIKDKNALFDNASLYIIHNNKFLKFTHDEYCAC